MCYACLLSQRLSRMYYWGGPSETLFIENRRIFGWGRSGQGLRTRHDRPLSHPRQLRIVGPKLSLPCPSAASCSRHLGGGVHGLCGCRESECRGDTGVPTSNEQRTPATVSTLSWRALMQILCTKTRNHGPKPSREKKEIGEIGAINQASSSLRPPTVAGLLSQRPTKLSISQPW